MATVTPSSTFKGWQNDPDNSALNFVYNGTTIGAVTASGLSVTGVIASSGAMASGGAFTVVTGGLTVTAGGATITAGNLVVTAGDARVTAGNVRLGAVSAFGS